MNSKTYKINSLIIPINKLVNEENKKLYENFYQRHVDDGGKFPHAYAITEVIRCAILNRNYLIYYGDGYEHKTNKIIKQYDIVVSFNWGNDPTFQMCLDNSDGDACRLINSNENCEYIMKYF